MFIMRMVIMEFRQQAKDISVRMKNLTMSEAAFLSAIPNNPTIYDPRTNKENTIKRRNKILKDMSRN